ncbi:MAG: copper amine oxidase, partial [Peptostreptococcus sp.]|nr:copper amine oxidase [Peptostreptococcus sp.]
MLEKFNTEIMKERARKALILLVSLVLILALFRLLHYHQSQRRIISEYKNTNIRERLITNNKVAQMKKPYKINNGIVYVPLIELCNNFGTKIEYKFLPFGEVEVKYKKYTYYMKRGSNEVRFAKNKDVLKMDGVMEYMEDTIYVPLDFIYKVLDVNVVQSSERTVYMDNYPKK